MFLSFLMNFSSFSGELQSAAGASLAGGRVWCPFGSGLVWNGGMVMEFIGSPRPQISERKFFLLGNGKVHGRSLISLQSRQN